MKKAFFVLMIGLALLHAGAQACGKSKYSSLALDFTGFNSQLTALGLTLKSDAHDGWVIQDIEGNQFYYRLSSSGATQPCWRTKNADASVCGDEFGKRVGPVVMFDQFELKDKQGKVVALLKAKEKSGFTLIPYDSNGKLSSDEVKIRPKLQSLDYVNYSAGIEIEMSKASKVASTVLAKRRMIADFPGLKNEVSQLRCISIPGPKGILSMTENQTVGGNSLGEITGIEKTTVVDPKAPVVAPNSENFEPATDR